jgi:hypothetical protein
MMIHVNAMAKFVTPAMLETRKHLILSKLLSGPRLATVSSDETKEY